MRDREARPDLVSTAIAAVIAVVLLVLVLAGIAAVFLGAGLMVVLLRSRSRAAPPAPARKEKAATPSPAPLTRLVPGAGGLRPEAARVGSGEPLPHRTMPTLAPVDMGTTLPENSHDGTEAFAGLDELFARLERTREEDSTELLSQDERSRLYGFDVGEEDPTRLHQNAADFLIEDDTTSPGRVVASKKKEPR